MKKILITGANSYIGTSFANYMAQWPQEYQVDTIDMVDGSWRKKSFSGFDCVFHVAGIAHQDSGKITEQRKQLYYRVNTDLAIETAKKAKADNAKQFIFMSSIIVYGASARMGEKKVITSQTQPAPEGAYGDSKLQAEKGIQQLADDAFRVCVLRPPMIYGPGCKGNYLLLEKASLRLPFFPDIQNERSMLYIDGLCVYIRQMIDTQASGIHFPQNPEYVCTSNMVREIAQAHGRSIRLTKVFNPLLRLLSGRVGVVDKIFGNLIYEQVVQKEFMPGLVSVVMPAYNASAFIELSIQSVVSQSYKNLELLVVDDCSTDSTVRLVELQQKLDSRIHLIKLTANSGTGAARNAAVEAAKGEFIAFIDSDDLWENQKIEKQINYMNLHNAPFTCTDYAVIDQGGRHTGEVRRAIPISDYNALLMHCPGNSTVVYQAGKLGKFYIPPIRKRNDYVMWLAVIKRAGKLVGLQETLSYYRIHSASLSIKKASLIKYHWIVYRKIENIQYIKSIYLLLYWIGKTAFKKAKAVYRNPNRRAG